MIGLAKLAPGEGHVALAERPERPPGPGEATLDVAAAGVCGTDLHIWLGEYDSVPPVTMGHEVTGTVAEVGAGVDEAWPPLVDHAGEHGVRIAIENCPMIFSYDEWPGGDNLAYAPAIWREMFTAIPDDNFGLNFDPSHLIWQMIDVERAVHEFGERIFHVHGKDLEVRPDGLYEHGTMSLGIGWQVPRLCGLGQVDWGRFIGALYAVGYDGVVSVEHEDRRFEGSVELVQRGFLIARNTLRPLLA